MLKHKTHRTEFFLCLVTVALSLAFGYGRSITLDESTTLFWNYQVFHYDFSKILQEIHTPSYDIALGVWLSFCKINSRCAVFFSTLMAAISIVVTYRLARRYFDGKTALFAALLLVFSPLHVFYSQYARTYAYFIAMSALSSYYYLGFCRAPGRKNALCYLVSTFLLISSHIAAFALVATQCIHFLVPVIRERDARKMKCWAALQLVLALLYAPILGIILKRYDLVRDIPLIYSWVPLPKAIDLWGAFLFLSGSSTVLAVVFGGLVAATVWDVYFCEPRGESVLDRSSDRSGVFYLLLWLFMPMGILFLCSYLFHPVFIERGFAPSAIPLIILAAFALSRVIKWRTAQWALVSGAILISGVAIGKRWFGVEEGWKELSRMLQDRSSEAGKKGEKELFFIHPKYAARPFAYYFKSECFYSSRYEDCLKQSGIYPIDRGEEIEAVLGTNMRIRFIGYDVTEKENQALIARLKGRPNLTFIGESKEFDSIDLASFEVTESSH